MQKGPYFNPVQYISPLPEGYLQASSNIANTLGKAVQGFGENIASGIEKYTKNKEESALLDSQAPILLADLKKRAEASKNTEDIARFQKMGDQLSKMPGQSVAQKRATVSGFMTELSLYDKRQQSQINQNQIDAYKQQQLERDLYSQGLLETRTKDVQGTVPMSGLRDQSQYVNAPNQQQIQPDRTNFNLGLYGEKERQGTAMPLGLGSAQGDIYSQSQPAQQQQQAQPGFMNSLAAMQANRPQPSAAPIAQPQAAQINAQINPSAFAQQANGSSLNAQTTMFGNPTYRDLNSYSNKPNNALSSFNEKMTYGIIDNFMDASAAVKGIAKMTGIPNAVLKTAGVVDRLSSVNYSPDNPTRRDDILAAFNGPPETSTKTQVAPQTKVTAQIPSFASVQLSKPTAFEASAGMIARGTVNLFEQPRVQNEDGSISTVDSVGVNIKGKEYLLPTVTPDGRHFQGTMKEKAAQATEEFNKTGQHLGVFNSVAASNKYAEKLHNDYADGKYDRPSQGSQFDQLFNQGVGNLVGQTANRAFTNQVDLTPKEILTNRITNFVQKGGKITPEMYAVFKKESGVNTKVDVQAEEITDSKGRIVGTGVIVDGKMTHFESAKAPKAAESPLGKMWDDYNSTTNPYEKASLMKDIAAHARKAEAESGVSLTEAQGNALTFALRMKLNEEELSKTSYRSQDIGSELPMFERWKSGSRKSFESSKSNWISANLRKESGAAINQDEYDKANKQYFPQSGDDQNVIDQKARLRRQSYLAMTAQIGPQSSTLMNRYSVSMGQEQPQGNNLNAGQSVAGKDSLGRPTIVQRF